MSRNYAISRKLAQAKDNLARARGALQETYQDMEGDARLIREVAELDRELATAADKANDRIESLNQSLMAADYASGCMSAA